MTKEIQNVSILMPLYNGIEFLEESVKSVINQTYKNWELIIGVNGYLENSDIELRTINIINTVNKNKIYDIKVIYYNTKGKSQTLNRMVRDVKYDYIALLDVDDIWSPNKLELQMPFLKDFDVIGTMCQYFGNLNLIPTIPVGDLSEIDLFSCNPMINSSIIINKKNALWDENSFVEDYDMWFRLYFDGKKFYNISEILCYHRIHNNSHFNNSNDMYVEILKDKWRKIIKNDIII